MTTSQLDTYFKPRIRNTSLPPTLYLHGAGGNAAEAVGAGGLDAVRTLLREVAAVGYNITTPTATQLWGNSTAISRTTDAITWNRSNLGSTNNPVVIIGASHGGTCALRYISDNPGDVACAVLVIPAVDMEDIRNTDVLGLRDDIDAAWGVTYPAPLPAGANPAQNTADYLGVPLQIWYATDDPVCSPSSVTAFATATGAEIHSVGNLGHSNAAIAAVDTQQVIDFIAANS
jgi:predicted alpha/beta hydrolase family esterase